MTEQRILGHAEARITGVAGLLLVMITLRGLLWPLAVSIPLRERNLFMQVERDYGGLAEAEGDDRLIGVLNRIIRGGVRALAVLMVLVILWGIADVIWVIYQDLIDPPFMILKISDILEIFGAFLVVLIAIEIYLNITMYLRKDVIHVRLVVATALMAIARKVIVFDFQLLAYEHVLATAAVVLSLGITYWLISGKDKG